MSLSRGQTHSTCTFVLNGGRAYHRKGFLEYVPTPSHGLTERGPGQALFYYISRAPLAFAGPRARIQMEAHTPCG